MLRRMREGGPGDCSELATATARWRPRSSIQREGEWVQEVAGVPRGAVGEAGGGLRALLGGRQRRLAPARREAEGERRKKEAGLVCKF